MVFRPPEMLTQYVLTRYVPSSLKPYLKLRKPHFCNGCQLRPLCIVHQNGGARKKIGKRSVHTLPSLFTGAPGPVYDPTFARCSRIRDHVWYQTVDCDLALIKHRIPGPARAPAAGSGWNNCAAKLSSAVGKHSFSASLHTAHHLADNRRF